MMGTVVYSTSTGDHSPMIATWALDSVRHCHRCQKHTASSTVSRDVSTFITKWKTVSRYGVKTYVKSVVWFNQVKDGERGN